MSAQRPFDETNLITEMEFSFCDKANYIGDLLF